MFWKKERQLIKNLIEVHKSCNTDYDIAFFFTSIMNDYLSDK